MKKQIGTVLVTVITILLFVLNGSGVQAAEQKIYSLSYEWQNPIYEQQDIRKNGFSETKKPSRSSVLTVNYLDSYEEAGALLREYMVNRAETGTVCQCCSLPGTFDENRECV